MILSFCRRKGKVTTILFLLIAFAICSILLQIFNLFSINNGIQEEGSSSSLLFLPSWMSTSPNKNPHYQCSACLLTMDDNHYLIEWLAYHYHVLNLRHVIIATDPKSVTTPKHILDRWRNKMTIIEWRDSNFMTLQEYLAAQTNVLNYFGTENVSPELAQHRARQRLFYYKCLQYFKTTKSTTTSTPGWTLLSDTDEFIRINYNVAKSYHPTIQALSITTPGSVIHLLNQIKQQYTSLPNTTAIELAQSPCVQIPRIRFNAQEDNNNNNNNSTVITNNNNNNVLTTLFNLSHFQTQRWKTHSPPGDYTKNKISKVILDLSRIPLESITEVDSIHMPIRSLCLQRRLHTRSTDSLLVMNHYLGSYEQFVYRNDARKRRSQMSIDQFEQEENKIRAPETDDDITPWLSGFVKQQGIYSSKQYLNNVGQLEPKSFRRYYSNERCAMLFFGLPRAFREMVLPSIVRNILIPNARHHCDVYVHFYNQQVEVPGRKNKGGTIDPLEIFLLKHAVPAVAKRHGNITQEDNDDAFPIVAFTHDSEDDFWKKRGPAIQRYHNTAGPDGLPAYFPYAAKTYTNSSLDNMVKQWHSIEYAFKLMDFNAAQKNVQYTRVGMFRSDALYVTPIDIAMLDKGQFDTDNHYAVMAPFARMPVNDRMIYGPYEAVKIWATKRFELIEKRVALRQDPGFEMHSEHFMNATILPAIEELGYEIHINRDICFLRTRADISAMINDCSIGGLTRGWDQVNRKEVVENIVGRNCTWYRMGIKWIFVGCGIGIEYRDG